MTGNVIYTGQVIGLRNASDARQMVWDILPLATWKKLARGDESAFALVRSDFGADSKFYREIVQLQKSGYKFTVERMNAGENLPTKVGQDGFQLLRSLNRYEVTPKPSGPRFAGDLYSRDYEDTDAAAEDDCFAGKILSDLRSATADREGDEDLPTASELDRRMWSCGTSPALHAPLKRLLVQLTKVRGKFDSASLREAHARELTDAFEKRFGGSKRGTRTKSTVRPVTLTKPRIVLAVRRLMPLHGHSYRESDSKKIDRHLLWLRRRLSETIKRWPTDAKAAIERMATKLERMPPEYGDEAEKDADALELRFRKDLMRFIPPRRNPKRRKSTASRTARRATRSR